MLREHDLTDTELAADVLRQRLVDAIAAETPSARHRRGGRTQSVERWQGWQQLLTDRAQAFGVRWQVEQNTVQARANIDTRTVVAVLVAIVNGCPPLTAGIDQVAGEKRRELPSRVVPSVASSVVRSVVRPPVG